MLCLQFDWTTFLGNPQAPAACCYFWLAWTAVSCFHCIPLTYRHFWFVWNSLSTPGYFPLKSLGMWLHALSEVVLFVFTSPTWCYDCLMVVTVLGWIGHYHTSRVICMKIIWFHFLSRTYQYNPFDMWKTALICWLRQSFKIFTLFSKYYNPIVKMMWS